MNKRTHKHTKLLKITKRELEMVEDLWNQRFNANYKLNTKSNG